MFLFTNSTCREALDDASYIPNWNADKKEAKQACMMLYDWINDKLGKCTRLRFTTIPASPYYFMQAGLERELHPTYVVNTQGTIIEKNDMEAVKQFLKHINIMNTALDADTLARMMYGFHCGTRDMLVTEHVEPRIWTAELFEPKLTQNEDGSRTLVYDLKQDGRSVNATRCTWTFRSAEDFNFDTEELVPDQDDTTNQN